MRINARPMIAIGLRFPLTTTEYHSSLIIRPSRFHIRRAVIVTFLELQNPDPLRKSDFASGSVRRAPDSCGASDRPPRRNKHGFRPAEGQIAESSGGSADLFCRSRRPIGGARF